MVEVVASMAAVLSAATMGVHIAAAVTAATATETGAEVRHSTAIPVRDDRGPGRAEARATLRRDGIRLHIQAPAA